jgi:hypothetical protein
MGLAVFGKEEIAEIEDVIGMLGDIDQGEEQTGIAIECSRKLYALIEPYLDEEQTR